MRQRRNAWRYLLIGTLLAVSIRAQDFGGWEHYRDGVKHPALAIKPVDLARAKANLSRYKWAQRYLKGVVSDADAHLARITPAFLDQMIEQTTPGDSEFTPCPACRALGKPWHPHGQWNWSVDRPEEIQCVVCKTVFPNDVYPESIVLHTTWGRPQTLSFFGGEPMEIFSYKTGRPSFTGSIRCRKVRYMSRAAYALAEAYLLTGDAKYAVPVRDILSCFAQVYPNWLVHVGYGEHADMDPRIAAAHIRDLPDDELVYPPNKPDRTLHTGYWTAGRGTGVGSEGSLIAPLLKAYDLTFNAQDPSSEKAIYANETRRSIEKDLFLESTFLLTADTGINNKSVAARTVCAEIGLCLGEPSLVRFGLDGFRRTLSEWFLPDGSTPESPAYAMMALGGIDELPQAMRGYSDPPGYADAQGHRLDNIDLYRDPKYAAVWQAMFQTLQGDLSYPNIADTRRDTSLSPRSAELMVANYPDRAEYLALLKAIAGNDLARGHASTALYYRETGLESQTTPPLALHDNCLPDLRIGYLRTGATGRESLLLLSASHWGSHHHRDSLNLTYWREGHELLSDLGYLWDHPKKSMTVRTLAHNTVLIDEQEQETINRGGRMEMFETSPTVKVMRTSSEAYPNAKLYRRTSAILHADTSASYIVDFFEVNGGDTQDFVFHGPNQHLTIEGADATPASEALYDFANIRALSPHSRPWRMTWTIGKSMEFTVWSVPQPGERAMIGDGWGQRDYKNSDVGATLPYVVRRTLGAGRKCFVTVYEAHPPGESQIKSVSVKTGGNELQISTRSGTDRVTLSPFEATLAPAEGP